MENQIKEGLSEKEAIEAACRCLCNCDVCNEPVTEKVKKSGE